MSIRRTHLHAVGCTSSLIAILAAAPARGDMLNPFVIGGVRDTLPKTGVGDTVSTIPFIGNNSSTTYRAIVEYDLTGVPQGTVVSASLAGKVGPNNSNDTGLREHRVEVYSGNGAIDLDDYSVTGSLAGQFSHASGSSTNYNLDVAAILQNLLSSGASYFGMRISPVSPVMAPDFLHDSSPPPRLNFEIEPAGSRSVSIIPTFDARVFRESDSYALSTSDDGILIQRSSFTNLDRRGVLEYDLAQIPVGADVTDAKIVFDVNLTSSGVGTFPMPPIYGYAGNGTPEIDDAFNTSQQIGVLGPVEDLGSITIDVDHEYIQSLLGNSDYFGVAIGGNPDGRQVRFYSLEGSGPPFFFGEPATLLLEYTLPSSPADFDGDGKVDGGDLATWQAAYGQSAAGDADDDNDSDGADFLAWQRALGGGAAVAGTIGVPEPTAAGLAILSVLFAAITRQPRRSRLT